MKSMYFRWQKAQINTVDIDYTNSSGDDLFTSDYNGTGNGAYSSTSAAIFASGESGSIGVTIGSTTETISVDDTTTLAGLASSIDALDGVSAYIVQIGTEAAVGSDGYQLFVQADTAGQFQGGDRFSLDFSNISHDGGTDATTNEQAATNATATIAGQTITSATNSFEAIDGITINAVSTGTATATVALDTSAMAAKVSTFVDAYNSMVNHHRGGSLVLVRIKPLSRLVGLLGKVCHVSFNSVWPPSSHQTSVVLWA